MENENRVLSMTVYRLVKKNTIADALSRKCSNLNTSSAFCEKNGSFISNKGILLMQFDRYYHVFIDSAVVYFHIYFIM